MTDRRFYLATYARSRSRLELYVWLKPSESHGYGPDRMVTACRDRDGEMVPCDIKLSDLRIEREC